ncbi:MAG: sn-glycerol-3-phosphate ABC transporter ATP-binding protein UgpC [candidate division NC10 bacterium]|nr:sn-glycerol-3-phosphate ABC transporter ATP-binding protein UgpC [candidate division NC10 bacterium]
MAQVTLESVTKRFDTVVAVRDVNLTVQDKEFVVLVGPSGCGKSTTLRMVAGLEEITGGTIKIADRVVNDVPPKDRDIAMVFQNYALYPHMSVYDNMAFGLKLRKFPKPEIQQRVKEAAEILGIQELLARKPRALSGGQRQRVAVGRAIVRKPQVFLFDEPLSNLDAKLRVAMRAELKKLHDRLQSTVIYVTHDQVEAMTMGDRIVIMKDGWIQQVGPPLEVYASPQNQFVAGFIGSPAMNFLGCTVVAKEGKLFFTSPGLSLPVPSAKAKALAEYKDKTLTMGLRPEDMHEATSQDASPSLFEARVEVVEPIGHEIYLNVLIDGNEIVARVSPDTPVKVGQKIKLAATIEKLHAFDPQTEKAIGL